MSDKLLNSLPKEQARTITTTQKTRPQMEGISSRSLLKVMPWVNVNGGFYRVNRRKVLEIRPGKVTFVDDSGTPKIFAPSLAQMPVFRKVTDETLLDQIAAAAVVKDFAKDAIIGKHGATPKDVFIIVQGKVSFFEPGVLDLHNALGTKGAGQYFGEFGLLTKAPKFEYDAKAMSSVKILKIAYAKIISILDGSDEHKDHLDNHAKHLEELSDEEHPLVNRKGESIVELHRGLHDGEPDIPSTFVEYDIAPREYELHTGQTILKIHSKVADLYNSPYNQTEEQVRLTIEELREAQEDEMINNEEFGLLHVADYSQRIHTRTGPPTPDDLDELLSKRRKTKYIFAHPKAVAAFMRECTKVGIYPDTVQIDGREVIAWRGCPILTCNKIPVVNGHTSMIAMRVGEDDHGVVGLYQMGLPEEVEPSLSVRYMGIDEKAIISYLITNYFSVAVLVPDALGILENVEVGVHES